MTRHLATAFTTHGVGQGLFYSGVIAPEEATRPLNFVYDCGVNYDVPVRPFLHQRVDSYRSQTLGVQRGTRTELDLLFVSHLHGDHASGLRRLLRDVSTKYVFLPYLSQVDRTIAALASPEAEEWYFDFLSDPVLYLKNELDVGKIVLMLRGGPPENDVRIEDRPRDPSEALDAAVRGLRDAESPDRLLGSEPNRSEWNRLRGNRDLLFKTDTRALNLPQWMFRFYSVQSNPDALRSFHVELQRLTAKLSLRDLLTVGKNRTLLRETYERLANADDVLKGEVNNTSLVTFHGPTKGATGAQQFGFDGGAVCCFGPHATTHPPRMWPFGTLLTGDINLRQDSIVDTLRDHFIHERTEVGTLFVPHHGSIDSWDATTLDDYPNAVQAIVSAGVDSYYRHPSPTVIRDLCGARRTLHWANQFCQVTQSMALELP
ncbi:MAG: hypothetical protein L3K23_06595 [Thermoplasmata archaeon]|nr:hypothetical protein [Thermoplasmata archaeon]